MLMDKILLKRHHKKLLQKEDNIALEILKKPVHWDIADSSENVDIYVYGMSLR
jgi:hypothetical protein